MAKRDTDVVREEQQLEDSKILVVAKEAELAAHEVHQKKNAACPDKVTMSQMPVSEAVSSSQRYLEVLRIKTILQDMDTGDDMEDNNDDPSEYRQMS